MRLLTEKDNFVQVIVKEASRNKEGKIEYTTVDSFNIADASGEEVFNFVENAFAKLNPSKKSA